MFNSPTMVESIEHVKIIPNITQKIAGMKSISPTLLPLYILNSNRLYLSFSKMVLAKCPHMNAIVSNAGIN